MKRVVAVFGSCLLVVGVVFPSSASAEFEVFQRTLAIFSGSSTNLTLLQKSQVKAAVAANPNAEKFICTGIRFHAQPMSVNIMVRKRAKEACEYAKQLNPNLSTWYQNKPTQARSYAGRVLLTIKSPANKVESGNGPESDQNTGPVPLLEPSIQGTVGGRVGIGFGTWPSEWPRLVAHNIFICEGDPNITASRWEKDCEPFNIVKTPGYILPDSEQGKYLVLSIERNNLKWESGTYVVKSGVITNPFPASAPIPLRAPAIIGGATTQTEVSFDTGTWPLGWDVTVASSLYVCVSNPLGNSDLLGSPACPLLTNAVNGPHVLQSDFAGRYLAARVVLTNGFTYKNYDLFRASLISSFIPSPAREPRIIGSEIVGETMTLDTGEWASPLSVVETYSVLVLCEAPLQQTMSRAKHGINVPVGCKAVSGVARLPATTDANWAGRYVGAIIHLVSSSGDYFDYKLGSPEPMKAVSPPIQQPIDPPEDQDGSSGVGDPSNDGQVTYVDNVSRRPLGNYCRYEFPNARFISGTVEIPSPSDFVERWGTSKTLYEATFVQNADGGYVTNARAYRYWRNNHLENWQRVDEEPLSWEWPVVSIVCRVFN